MTAWLQRNKIPIAAFFVALVAYGAVAGERLLRRSPDPHFVVQADAWVHGHFDIKDWPKGADDPARIDEVRLDDGRTVRGRKLTTRQTFQVAGEGEIPIQRVKQTLRTISYNSFPPFPSVLLVPQALISGAQANDVVLTLLLAALIPAMLLVLLRQLREAGLHARSTEDELWLAALLSFGTVLFFTSVGGRVWFTAQVVGVLFSILYLWAAQGARRPFLAGLFLACAVTTRPSLVLLGVIFVVEAYRQKRLRSLIAFAIPMATIGALAAAYNFVRFNDLTEFGHNYLAVRQQAQMERYGLFNVHYLGRNLAVALTLLPEFLTRWPYVTLSGHGLAVWITTPALVLLLWPRARTAWHLPLWLAAGGIAVWSLLYQNSGWVQFGYRFILDYIVLLVVLLALSARPFGRWTKALIVAGVLVNLFGAITFNRMNGFYRQDDRTYDCVVPD